MIIKENYFTEFGLLEYAKRVTQLSEDEIIQIVGYFHKDHWRFPGKLKGKLCETIYGDYEIRHHFTNKVLWRP